MVLNSWVIHLSAGWNLIFKIKVALCQLSWVEEKLQPGEDHFVPLLFNVQSGENSSFKVIKVPKAESIALDDPDEVVSSFKFCI